MFKPKLPQQNEGFTLVEVLVAILIASMFVGVAMQAIAIAAVFKARAQEYTEATAWIQEDLEDIKEQAANFTLPSTSLTTNVNSVAGVNTALTVASVTGFQVNDNLIIGSDSTSNTIASIDTGTNTITLNAPLDSNWLANTVVVATSPMCSAAITRTTGFADALRDRVTATDVTNGITGITNTNDTITGISKSSKLTTKAFTMTRTATLSPTVPHNILEIRYTVTPTSGGSSVADFYTEVIPNAVFQCP